MSALKRKRTEPPTVEDESSQANTTTKTRSETVWFDDGNIVLEAEGKQFRVHRGVLEKHSSVFKDMLSVPQPPESDEPTIDGCPIVQLPDKADDWEHLLNSLYDWSVYSYGNGQKTYYYSVKY